MTNYQRWFMNIILYMDRCEIHCEEELYGIKLMVSDQPSV